MPFVPESSAGPADRAVVNDYDIFAEAYSAGNEASLINGYYTRPAIVNLAGDVAGRRILDVGCGSGPISAALRDRGATVAGFDSSTKMVELARKRLGPRCRPADSQPRPPAAIPRRRVRRRHRGPRTALPAGLDGTAGRAAAHPQARRPTDRGRRPSLRDRHPAARSRTQARLLRDLQLVRRVDPRRPHSPDELLDPAAARNDRRLYRNWVPDSRRQRATPAPGARELFPNRLPDTPFGAFLCFLFFVLEAS
jgi:Methyltransferase domain